MRAVAQPGGGGDPRVAVVVPTVDPRRLLPACLAALAGQSLPAFRVVVVVGGRAPGWVPPILRERTLVVELGRNRGFAAAVNAGIAATDEPLVALLNDDARPESGWLEALTRALAAEPRAAFACGKVLSAAAPALLESAGDGVSRLFLPYPVGHLEPDRGQFDAPRWVLGATGCAVLFRRSLVEEVGPFEESFFAYMEDVDFFLRAALMGHRGRYVPEARVVHLGGATSGGRFGPLAVRLSTRNLVRVQLRILTGAQLLRGMPRLLAGHVYWGLKMAVKEGAFLAWLRGLLAGLAAAPADRRFHRALRRRPGVDPAAFALRLAASAAEVTASRRRKRAAARGRRGGGAPG